MTKQEMVSYLVGIIKIQDSMDDAGRLRSDTLTWEYERTYSELKEILNKEREDEARKRK